MTKKKKHRMKGQSGPVGRVVSSRSIERASERARVVFDIFRCSWSAKGSIAPPFDTTEAYKWPDSSPEGESDINCAPRDPIKSHLSELKRIPESMIQTILENRAKEGSNVRIYFLTTHGACGTAKSVKIGKLFKTH